MRVRLVAAALALGSSTVLAGPPADTGAFDATAFGGDAVAACLSCHFDENGTLDIVGLSALSAVPPEWPFLFEDQFDLDGDGIAGRMRFVSGQAGPVWAKFGRSLAASRFEDFAQIAAAAHGIDLSPPGTMERLKTEFEARSPAPTDPFPDAAALEDFEARGCARCHVTYSFEVEGVSYRPLSDFLLHDMGDGLRRTAPLWGCPDCVIATPHAALPEPGG